MPGSRPGKLALCLLGLTVLCLAPVSEGLAQSGKTGKAGKIEKRQTEPVAANIDRNGILILVRSTLLALDHANKTGNYTVLRDLGAPGLQEKTAAQLGDIFAEQRRDGLDLGGVAVLDPQLTLLPQIEPNGMLHMAGFIPSVPVQVNFELLFAPVERQWRLFGISVNLTSGSPAAPEGPPASPVALSTEKPVAPTTSVNPKRPASP